MSDVFISYSRDNLDIVSRIAEAVQREGYDLWWDADLPPHRSYGDVIQEKIDSAKAVIVVWSESSAASEWVRAEADMARNQKKLIQTSVDDAMPPLPFNQIQFASLSGWNGETDHRDWRKVLISLADLAGKDAKPIAAVSPRKNVPSLPPERPSAPLLSSNNALPITLSALALAGFVGLAIWFFLSGDSGDKVPKNAEIAEFPDAGANDDEQTGNNAAVQSSIAPVRQSEPLPPASATRFAQKAVINDNDGWTNIRTGPSATSPVVGRIEAGERFYSHQQSDNWWQVRTANGLEGYMHGSRIRFVGNEAANPQMIIADSDRRLLQASEIAALSKSELRIARNEIFARHGRRFNSPELKSYFARFDWYKPVSAEVQINAVEKTNAAALQAEEQRR